MKTALTVVTTAILTAIAFLFAWQQGFLGGGNVISIPHETNDGLGMKATDNCKRDEAGAPCTTPWGENIAHGDSVLSFKEISDTDEKINCKAITSTCNDGTWYKDIIPSEKRSCTLSMEDIEKVDTKNCTLGDIIIPNGTTYTFYKEIKNNDKYTYQKSKRKCSEGTLEGDASYNKINMLVSCPGIIEEKKPEIKIEPTPKKKQKIVPIKKPIYKKAAPKKPKYNRCTSPSGKTWNHGEGGSYYTSKNVPYGGVCTKTQVVCGYGSLRKGNVDGTQTSGPFYTSCEVLPPLGCSSNCGKIGHGQSVTTYKNASLPYGGGTTCNSVQVVSTCSNGSFDTVPASSCSCKVSPPAGCTAPNGKQYAHGSSVTLYKDKTIQPVSWDGTDTCVRQGGKCVNGRRHDRGGNPVNLTFRYSTCTILPPPTGSGPGGEGVPQG